MQMKESRIRGVTGLQVLLYLAALVLACLQFGPGTQAQVKQPVRSRIINDPVFGISYHEGEAHYDPVPSSILQLCRTSGPGQYWIYADVQRNGRDYLVVSGIPQHQDGDLFGSALQVANGHCDAEDSTWMLSGSIPPGGYADRQVSAGLPGLKAPESCDNFGNCRFTLRSHEEEEILRALLQDALERGIRAWGGESRFAARACAPNLMLSNSSTPVLQSTLKKFCDAHR